MKLSTHLCECGCGEFTYISPQNDSRYGYIKGKPYRFRGNHFLRLEEFKKKISATNSGVKNGMWKGNDVKYNALHDWVKYHLKKPDRCSNCGCSGLLDVTNISGKYLREISDWRWLCRKCHMLSDGRMQKRDIFGRFTGDNYEDGGYEVAKEDGKGSGGRNACCGGKRSLALWLTTSI
jgi:hypothetical protein